MADFSTLPPKTTLNVQPFKAHVEDSKLEAFKQLLKLSPIGPPTFENSACERRYGVTRDWLTNAKDHWLNNYDYRKCEDRINSFPNFKATVKDADGNDIELQFLALFSEKADAIPIGFYHGWPGSIIEFLDLLDILRKRHTPKDLPYHVVVPSLPGYAYSSGPPVDKDYSVVHAAGALHNLMLGLGFGDGYLVQGGDIGSFASRVMAMSYDACKGMHINLMIVPPQKGDLHVDEVEQKTLDRGDWFFEQGFAYAFEHGTRTATIGHTLSASPLALLSWIGEKFLEWSDEDPPLDQILDDVTLYWLTDTFPRCIYPYRNNSPHMGKPALASSKNWTNRKDPNRTIPKVEKPVGYSLFRYEINGTPKTWAQATHNLVSYNQHEKGGHFAAMERPAELLADVEEWIPKAWNASRPKL